MCDPIDDPDLYIRVAQEHGLNTSTVIDTHLIVESRIVGMSIHATSLALKEEVTFDHTHVTSLDWNSYPVLRFAEHPAVTPIVV